MLTPQHDEERRRARAYAESAVAVVGSAAVEFMAVPDVACVDVQPPGGITVAVRAWVRDVQAGPAVAALVQLWTADGCQVLDDRRGGPLPTVMVQRPDDGFWLRVAVNGQGDLMITASSPCLWPATPASTQDSHGGGG